MTTVAPLKQSAWQRVFGALGDNQYYRSYWVGNQANTLVMQMQMVANGYLAFTITGSATALGLVAFASSLPMLLFSPAGGVLADRLQKRKLLLWIQASQCLISIVIGLLVGFDRIEYWHLIVSAALQGVSFAVMMPTRQSMAWNACASWACSSLQGCAISGGIRRCCRCSPSRS